jgi:FixJ family two-component response regulator
MSLGRRFVVAVVDDDPRVLESLENLLQSAGYTVQTHGSAGSLLVGGVEGIDCLITDIGMPGMDGLELRDQVRLVRPGLPVFLISGRLDLANVRRLERGGDSEFFSKPFDGRALLLAVDKVLRGADGGQVS